MRMRRKALAAAGLTEDNLKDANSTLEADFKLRLSELEKAHAAKRREKRAQKAQPSAFVRTKVRVWRSNIRRRKSPRSSRDDEDHQLKEQWTLNGGEIHQRGLNLQRVDSPGSLLTRDSASFMSDSSRAPSPRRSLSRAGLSSSCDPTTGSETVVDTAPSAESDRTSGDVGESLSPSTSAQDATATTSLLPEAPAPGPSGHMPPAYRPASVRSLNVAGPSSSSSRAPPPTPTVLSPEKATAAGFYPAPATADAEIAQAVVRRSDAKAPIVVPPGEEERRAMHHVATDDKRELERLRLGGSAPPVNRVEDENGAGPSAPSFEVDGEGFETLAIIDEDDSSGPNDNGTSSGPGSGESLSASASASGFGSTSSRLTVPGLPAPPRATALRSLRTLDSEGHSRPPSAPPSPAPSAPCLEPSAPPLAPSAPPMEPSAPPTASAPPLDDFEEAAPSAPPLDDEENEGDGSGHDEDARSRAHSRASNNLHPSLSHEEVADDVLPPPEHDDASDVRDSLNVPGHGFLPRYEP